MRLQLELRNIRFRVNEGYTIRFSVKKKLLRKLPSLFTADVKLTNIRDRNTKK